MSGFDELEMLKLKKFSALMRKAMLEKQREEEKKRVEERLKSIVSSVLTDEALKLLESIRAKKPDVARKIELVILDIIRRYGSNIILDDLVIEAIRRKIEGVEPTIRIVKQGEEKSFEEYLREKLS